MGQRGEVHYFHDANLPPGVVAQGQVLRDGLMLAGHVQPIEIVLPEGVEVSLNVGGQFDEPRPGPVRAGMLIGPVYALKVTQIPFRPGEEIFPTVEVVNRIFPPPGQEQQFAIPVHITSEDLELAASGRFVTRVIYLEDAATALPFRDDPRHQRYFDAPPGGDPLRLADEVGKPMAILRLGSRVPLLGESSSRATPPVLLYPQTPEAEPTPADASGSTDVQAAIERQPYNVPRIPLPGRTASRFYSPDWPRTR
jgi:hypothetical protein